MSAIAAKWMPSPKTCGSCRFAVADKLRPRKGWMLCLQQATHVNNACTCAAHETAKPDKKENA